MKAVVARKYGPPDVLQIQEVATPSPKDNEVLIRIQATTVTAGDSELRRFKFPIFFWPIARVGFGFRAPRNKILGQELAGDIESVGKDVRSFRTGDQVFAPTGFGLGAYAEYKCLPEDKVTRKPANMTYEEAAAVPIGGENALHFLKKGNIQPGQKVLIYGGSGSIGTFAIQLAKYFGGKVTAVGNPTSLEMMRSLGAEKVFDYTKEDFSKSAETYDVIFDAIGKSSFSSSKRSLTERGVYLLANPLLSHIVRGLWTSMTSSKKVIVGVASEKTENMIFLKELIEEGKIRSVIDRRYPMEQIVEAHSYVDQGHKNGNVVITLNHDKETKHIGTENSSVSV